MAPTAGLIDQLTAVFAVFVTVAANCWVCDADRGVWVGLMATERIGHASAIAMAFTLAAVLADKVHAGALPEMVFSNDAAVRVVAAVVAAP